MAPWLMVVWSSAFRLTALFLSVVSIVEVVMMNVIWSLDPLRNPPQYRNCKRKKRKETHAIHKKQKFLDDTPEDTTP